MMSSHPSNPPPEFYCILSKNIMIDPVTINITGETYERKCIEDHLTTKLTCPRSGKVLHKTPTLIPNSLLKRLIEDWSNKDSPKAPSVKGKKEERPRLWRSREVKLHNFLKAMHKSDKDGNYYAILNIAKTMFECISELKRMSKGPPEEFCCILSKKIMKDPVTISATAEIYERESIEDHLRTNLTCPKSGKVLFENPKLIPHLLLKGLILDWSKKEMEKKGFE
ncbi:U-box domain-containing protein 13-like protein [Tanacetum coccineum]